MISNNTLIDSAGGKIKKKVATMNAANSGLAIIADYPQRVIQNVHVVYLMVLPADYDDYCFVDPNLVLVFH